MLRVLNKILMQALVLTVTGLVSLHALAADTAGSVSFVIGDANVVVEAGKTRPLLRGDNVDAGQVVVTGSNGHVHLRMVDGAFVSVRPASRLRIEEYHYDAVEPGKSRIKFSLEQGVARSITGRAGEAAKEIYRLNTPLAAIGIRGTDFVVQADNNVTRVVVQSGAIVMSPLNADCLVSALGPCNSATTRVLTAAMRDAYLELRNRNGVPLLIPAEKALDSPNVLSPPRPEEPRAGADKGKPGSSSSTYATDAAKVAAVDNLKNQAEAITPPVVVPPTDVKPPVEIPSKIWWGRWNNVTALADRPTVASQISADREITFANSVFGLLRDAGDAVVPNSGVAKFQLADSEAYLMTGDKVAFAAAKIKDPSLTVDFGNRRYDTSLTVTSNGISPVGIQSSGAITSQGVFVAGSNSANTEVLGTLSRNGDQAGYLFQRDLLNGTSVIGATRWTR